MGRPKKIKTSENLEDLHQTHGKVDSFQPTTLDQIWGDTGLNKYNTLELDVYLEKLNDLSKFDLQAHAREVGLVPIDDIERMRKTLIQYFEEYVNNYKQPKTSTVAQGGYNKEVAKILAEGR